MQLDADVAGNVGGSEVDFGDGGDGLARGVERGRDIVVVGEKADGPWRLGAKRRNRADERNDKQYCTQGTNFSAEGHQTTFQLSIKMGHLSPGCGPTPFCLYRIAETRLSVASDTR